MRVVTTVVSKYTRKNLNCTPKAVIPPIKVGIEHYSSIGCCFFHPFGGCYLGMQLGFSLAIWDFNPKLGHNPCNCGEIHLLMTYNWYQKRSKNDFDPATLHPPPSHQDIRIFAISARHKYILAMLDTGNLFFFVCERHQFSQSIPHLKMVDFTGQHRKHLVSCSKNPSPFPP